jgi:phage terminase small subunit
MDKPLNIRQQRFAEFVVSGMPATQAYIKAGYKTTEKAAGANSARLIENDKIKALIAKLRAPDTARAVLTKDEKREILADLIRKRKITPSDIVRCMAEDSRLAGHYEAERHIVDDGPNRIASARERALSIASPLNRFAQPAG